MLLYLSTKNMMSHQWFLMVKYVYANKQKYENIVLE